LISTRQSVSPPILVGVVVVVLAACAALVVIVTQPRFSNGLVAHYYRSTDWTGPAAIAVERQIPNPAQGLPDAIGQPFTATWQGFLFIARAGEYRFALASESASWLRIDGAIVVNNGRPASNPGLVTTRLDEGLHALELAYAHAGGSRALNLLWGHGTEPLTVIPESVLFPSRIAYWTQAGLRRFGYLLPLFASTALMAVPMVWLASHLSRHLHAHRGESAANAGLLSVLGLTLLLAIPGMGWGLPDFRGWAPDELVPASAIEALQWRFSNGWHSPYPPLHYYILGTIALPFDLMARAGAIDIWQPHTHLVLFFALRMASVLMAIATVYVVYLCALELEGGRIAAVLSALLVVSMPPFLFYAKLANVDVPYVFWFALSLLYYVRFVSDPTTSNLVGFGVAGMLAICTKDQAYAFYILPAAYVLWLRYRSRRSAGEGGPWRDQGMFGAAAAAIVTFALGQNLVFNWSGFRLHVDQILQSSTYPPLYEASLSGHLQMLVDVVGQISWSMGWPSLAVCVAGGVLIARRRPRLTAALALMALSYYLFFIGVIRYHFDRFFLGICVILALFGGQLLVASARHGVIRLASAALIVYGVLYGSFVSVAMVTDSRYYVESWMNANVPSDRVVGFVGVTEYLPRLTRYTTVRVPESWADTAALKPDVIVINVGFSCRARPGSPQHEFYGRLNDPANGLYRQALSHRADPWWPVRGPDSVSRASCENGVTNLGKINPEIRVFLRTGVGVT
jgi:hypothetical protein